MSKKWKLNDKHIIIFIFLATLNFLYCLMITSNSYPKLEAKNTMLVDEYITSNYGDKEYIFHSLSDGDITYFYKNQRVSFNKSRASDYKEHSYLSKNSIITASNDFCNSYLEMSEPSTDGFSTKDDYSYCFYAEFKRSFSENILFAERFYHGDIEKMNGEIKDYIDGIYKSIENDIALRFH